MESVCLKEAKCRKGDSERTGGMEAWRLFGQSAMHGVTGLNLRLLSHSLVGHCFGPPACARSPTDEGRSAC